MSSFQDEGETTVAFFDDFTSALKQKWLQYYQLNHGWLALQMEVESIKTPDGGRRPPSYLILGILNALEPKLAQLMLPFSRLNSDADALIEVLELNFDPEIALGNRPPAKASATVGSAATIASPTSAPTAVSALMDDDDDEFAPLGEEEPVAPPSGKGINLGAAALGVGAVAAVGMGAVAAASMLQEDEEIDLDDISQEPTPIGEELVADGFDDVGLDEFGSESLEDLSDKDTDEGFDDISLDTFGEEEETLKDTSDDEFGGLSDMWSGESTEDLGEESLADFADISLDEFGSVSDKKSDDDLDAFGELEFDPFADPDKEDHWK